MKEKLVVIVGPTGVGKTKLSIQLSHRFYGEVISGDSMQLYKGMDIGTDKITKEEQYGIPHHLIDIIEPTESFSVAQFQQKVIPTITNINKRGRIPFLVGGTGLYIHSIIKGYTFEELPTNEQYRKKLERLATEKGVTYVHNMLKELDPPAAATIHPNNVRRVIRALEIMKVTGKPFSKRQLEEQNEEDEIYDLAFIALTMDRKKLYKKINDRVDMMVEIGLIEEAKQLYDRGIKGYQSVQAIGYKELYDYFDGHISKEEAISLIKRNSRRYAKRQLTWFRNKSDATWFDMTDGVTNKKIDEISIFIEGKLQSL